MFKGPLVFRERKPGVLFLRRQLKSDWEAVWTLVGAAVCYQNDLSKEIFFMLDKLGLKYARANQK